MGFGEEIVRETLRQHFQSSKSLQPFINTSSCIIAILKYMKEKRRRCLYNNNNILPPATDDDDDDVGADVVGTERVEIHLPLELTIPPPSQPPSPPPSFTATALGLVEVNHDIERIESSAILKTKEDTIPIPNPPFPQSIVEKQLTEELNTLKNNIVCKICLDNNIEIVLYPCLHMVTCYSCTLNIKLCPICRKDILYISKPIIS
ncbi:Baculoviral IAP repeat-containing protein 7 [Astathelohania contejeani]|uniref:Baculoviral IAP repeat-containing protein 7 n=1 Tax=Astathelohania contejeani TaxID=164912 RepID=A0ABQ7HWU9_9MICR|nr:Baculoviral IAP repeat-containing protein 7 [Thelohania contejeani]